MYRFIEEHIKEIGKEAHSEGLKAQEKEAMKLQLMEFVKRHPIEESSHATSFQEKPQNTRFTSWNVFGMRYLRIKVVSYALAALALVVVMGGGVALAANSALPGNPLYPIKLNVNEKVLSWLATSSEEKAQLHITLAKKRLQEVEKATANGSFDEKAAIQAKVSFNKHVSAAEDSINAIGKEQGTELSANLNSGFESLLRAHVQIMGNLIAEHKDDGKDKEAIKDFQANVDDRINSVVKENTEDQEKIFSSNASNMASYAQSKFADAQKKIQETTNFVTEKKRNLSEEAFEAALANIVTAGNLIVKGQQKVQQQEYRNAVLFFQKAVNVMGETQIGVLTNEKVKINIENNDLQDSVQKDDNHHDQEDDSANLIKGSIQKNILKNIRLK